MTPNAYQNATVTCPGCRSRFVTPILTVIDAGSAPEAKGLLLSGQINIAACPQCGRAGMLAVPLVYHDSAKELLYTYVPPEMGLSEAEQQRVIGDQINRLMASLPVEQRKAYLLRPTSFFRMDTMVESILEADGITREMLEAQRARVDLLERLLHTPGEAGRQAIARENDEQLDYEFFQLLQISIDMAESAGGDPDMDQLIALREQLMGWTSWGQEMAAREEAIRSLGQEITRDGVLDRLVEAALSHESAKVETIVAFARPAIDYAFYQQLASRIEASELGGNLEQATQLKALRQTVLDLTAEIDSDMQRATEAAAQYIRELTDAQDPDQMLRAQPERIDELLISVLGASLQAAEKAGQTATASRLARVQEAVLTLIRESQPPEIRLVNELLAADHPDGTLALLSQHQDLVTERLLATMDALCDDLAARGRAEPAERLALVRRQAATLLSTAA